MARNNKYKAKPIDSVKYMDGARPTNITLSLVLK